MQAFPISFIDEINHCIETSLHRIRVSKVSIVKSRERLLRSNSRTHSTIGGGCGPGEDSSTRGQRTQAKVATRQLPPRNGAEVWGGDGSGAVCSGCGDPIAITEKEYEVVCSGALKVFLHRECFVAWSNCPAG
jgi:hypothetical protein